MRSLIFMLSLFIGYICLTSLTMPPACKEYKYKPPRHGYLWENCELYYVNGGYIGQIAPDTSFGFSGQEFIHSSERRIHMLGHIETDIRIVGAHSIFISGIKETGNARITNYDGMVTIYNDKRSIQLETNETLLIDKDGKFEKFTNEFARADSLWLTAGEIWIYNVDMPTLINRMAINFGCKVQFNYLPSNERVINAANVYFDCKSESLLDGLQLLQTSATGSQKFSYRVNNGIIFIDK